MKVTLKADLLKVENHDDLKALRKALIVDAQVRGCTALITDGSQRILDQIDSAKADLKQRSAAHGN